LPGRTLTCRLSGTMQVVRENAVVNDGAVAPTERSIHLHACSALASERS
jgi:hypothetical protein